MCRKSAPNQSCTCNGYQGNWVRANVVEALCNFQIVSLRVGARGDVMSTAVRHVSGEELSAVARFVFRVAGNHGQHHLGLNLRSTLYNLRS